MPPYSQVTYNRIFNPCWENVKEAASGKYKKILGAKIVKVK